MTDAIIADGQALADVFGATELEDDMYDNSFEGSDGRTYVGEDVQWLPHVRGNMDEFWVILKVEGTENEFYLAPGVFSQGDPFFPESGELYGPVALRPAEKQAGFWVETNLPS